MFALGVLLGAMIVVSTLFSIDFKPGNTEEVSVTYADLAAIVLTAVAVLVAVMGVGMAILAFWGYTSLKTAVVKAAEDQLKQELRSGTLRKVLEDRVDEVVFRGAEDRAAEETEGS